jgi:hypothetical protein
MDENDDGNGNNNGSNPNSIINSDRDRDRDRAKRHWNAAKIGISMATHNQYKYHPMRRPTELPTYVKEYHAKQLNGGDDDDDDDDDDNKYGSHRISISPSPNTSRSNRSNGSKGIYDYDYKAIRDSMKADGVDLSKASAYSPEVSTRTSTSTSTSC